MAELGCCLDWGLFTRKPSTPLVRLHLNRQLHGTRLDTSSQSARHWPKCFASPLRPTSHQQILYVFSSYSSTELSNWCRAGMDSSLSVYSPNERYAGTGHITPSNNSIVSGPASRNHVASSTLKHHDSYTCRPSTPIPVHLPFCGIPSPDLATANALLEMRLCATLDMPALS
jgi:hypothetical protein